MANVGEILEQVENKRVIVVGDAMLDHYVSGQVHRMSPEAPVPVLHHQLDSYRLGGAANVALNLEGLGIETCLFAAIGRDEAGSTLQELATRQISDAQLSVVEGRPTTLKTRIVDKEQQLLRIDRETNEEISEGVSRDLLKAVKVAFTSNNSPTALVLSDYNKGVLTEGLVKGLIDLATKHAIPVLIDPKGQDFSKYAGATLITPNIKELETVLAMPCSTDDNLHARAEELRTKLSLESLVVTLGAEGLLLVQDDLVLQFPALSQEVFDVSGAGDTVLAAITAGLLADLPLGDALNFANLCASKVIQKRGTTAISKELLSEGRPIGLISHIQGGKLTDAVAHRLRTLRNERRRIVFTNGCFDLLHRGHVELLGFAKSQGDVLIVGLNSDDSVKRLKGEGRPINNEQDRAVMLSALVAVDLVVVFDQDTPLELIKEIRPDVLIKGADYADKLVVGQAEVESWGGEVKLCPILDGYSTTNQIVELSNREAIETVRQPN